MIGTVEKVKARFGMEAADVSLDPVIEQFLRMATSLLEFRSGRKFEGVLDDTFSGLLLERRIYLPRFPLVGITSVTVKALGQEDVVLEADVDYRDAGYSGIVEFSVEAFRAFRDRTYVVVYSGGFALTPESPSSEFPDIPDGITDPVVEQASAWLAYRNNPAVERMLSEGIQRHFSRGTHAMLVPSFVGCCEANKSYRP